MSPAGQAVSDALEGVIGGGVEAKVNPVRFVAVDFADSGPIPVLYSLAGGTIGNRGDLQERRFRR